MLLQFSSGEAFAIGSAKYDYAPVSEYEQTPRIILQVKLEGFRTSAFVDTGGIYLICPPNIANELHLDPGAAIPTQRLLFRGQLLTGNLHRVALTVIAHSGEEITVEATTFVPEGGSGWTDFPCILGMVNCLDRFRFAIDPGNDHFYFGELT